MSAVFPLILACYVACTRVSDNRHFLRDVAVGAIIGSLTSIWFYYQYFPSIMDLKNRGRAYPPRRFGISKFFQHVGGFWSIDDDVGAFNEREVNSLEGINRLIGNSGEPLESLDLSTNLEFVQRYIT